MAAQASPDQIDALLRVETHDTCQVTNDQCHMGHCQAIHDVPCHHRRQVAFILIGSGQPRLAAASLAHEHSKSPGRVRYRLNLSAEAGLVGEFAVVLACPLQAAVAACDAEDGCSHTGSDGSNPGSAGSQLSAAALQQAVSALVPAPPSDAATVLVVMSTTLSRAEGEAAVKRVCGQLQLRGMELVSCVYPDPPLPELLTPAGRM